MFFFKGKKFCDTDLTAGSKRGTSERSPRCGPRRPCRPHPAVELGEVPTLVVFGAKDTPKPGGFQKWFSLLRVGIFASYGFLVVLKGVCGI